MPDFGDAERRILAYFEKGTKFIFHDREYEVIESGKPTCNHGEPKTDVYVAAKSGNDVEELKISYKKENADFLENKTNKERAEQLFGPNWRDIIQESTTSIKPKFEDRAVVFKEKNGRTEKGAITLGWKFELLNKPGGDLSGEMKLNDQQVYDVYAGTNLSEDKKNAVVNGKVIQNSGVADYILMDDNVNSAQDVVDRMTAISDYIKQHPKIYFACKALNYRTFAEKYDGDRPLSVQVDWTINDGKLHPQLDFNHPLEQNGNEMYNRLARCMNYLSIKTTDDINYPISLKTIERKSLAQRQQMVEELRNTITPKNERHGDFDLER